MQIGYSVNMYNRNLNPSRNVAFGSGRFPMTQVPKYIETVISKLKQAASREEMYKVLDDAVANIPEFKALDNTVFSGGGYNFTCTLNLYKPYIDEMKKNGQIHLLDIINIKNTNRCVIITKNN